jgi:hypothetical protein
MILVITMLASSALMLARPASITVTEPEDYNRDIMLCLDTSGSMTKDDAKIVETFAELARNFRGERVGLAIWDSSAVTIFPLTDDYDFVTSELGSLSKSLTSSDLGSKFISSGTMQGDGSSLVGDGLASCINNFDNEKVERSRSVILATDNYVSGAQLITLPEAAQVAKDKNIRVYGLNPADWSRTSYVDKVAEEYRQSVMLTGGTYYRYDDRTAIPGIIAEINRQDATRFKGAPQLIRRDQPSIPIVVFFASMVGLFVLVWRLRI